MYNAYYIIFGYDLEQNIDEFLNKIYICIQSVSL